MAIVSTLTAALALTPFITSVVAHTDAQIQNELNLRRHVTANNKRALEKCTGSPAVTALKERAIARRAAKARALREKRGLQNRKMHRRDEAAYDKWTAVSHDFSAEDFTTDTSVADLFAANATTCTVVPEIEIGPYYVVGELMRTDLVDGEEGVPIHLDLQFVDVSTCEAMESLLVDIWHCNSLGIYSGVSEDQDGLDTTHGRGVQQSDSDGVVEFDTLYPGHYSGRTNHIHVMTTVDAELFDNGTFTGGTARHIGQMFFEESLSLQVEAMEPYSTNEQARTTNEEDRLTPQGATDEYDPFIKYVMLGDDLSDGLLMWQVIGIDTTADYSDNVSAAAHYYEDGGVAEENGGAGAPGGGAPPDGGAPLDGEGAPENGTATEPADSATEVVTEAPTGTAADAVGETSLASSVAVAGAGRAGALFFF